MRLIRKNVERLTDDPVKAAKMKAEGYTELENTQMDKMPSEERKDVSGHTSMTTSELKKLAKEKGVEGYTSLTREELLIALKEEV